MESVENVLAKITETYASCPFYRDKGFSTMSFDRADGSAEVLQRTQQFVTLFRRPSRFLFASSSANGSVIAKGIVWRGEKVLLKMRSREVEEGPAIDIVIAAGEAPIPKLLFGQQAFVSNWPANRCRLLPEMVIHETHCVGIELPRFMDCQTTVWFESRTWLVRRLIEQHFSPFVTSSISTLVGEDQPYFATQTHEYLEVEITNETKDELFGLESLQDGLEQLTRPVQK